MYFIVATVTSNLVNTVQKDNSDGSAEGNI